jgi:NAD+ diphosphatase
VDHLKRSLGNGLVYWGLERAAELRVDDHTLRELLNDPGCGILPVSANRNLVTGDLPARAVWIAPGELAIADTEALIFLGKLDGRPCFTIDIPADDPRVAELEKHGCFTELRAVGSRMADQEAAALSYARGMCYWHHRHAFCGTCGYPTRSMRGGHVRICTNAECGIHHFPRTDPAIIVLVHDGDRCLLGRKPEWPAGRFSTIAGFVEPGEAVEQAVVREVYEETGVGVGQVSYHSSQPWPFPGSVMLGFHARAADSKEIELLDGELEDARWFSRGEVGQALDRSGPLRLPPRISIARRLIEDWYHHGHL